MAGTSMASPVVAGVVGLMLTVDPKMSVSRVKSILYSTADDIMYSGYDPITGWGRVNAQAAVRASTPPVPKITAGATFVNDSSEGHKIGFYLKEAGRVTVSIKNKSGKTVRTIVSLRDYNRGQRYVYWDGFDNDGKKVSNGAYKIFVYFKDAYDGLYYSSKALTYRDQLAPVISANAKYTNDSGDKYKIQYTTKLDSKVIVRIKDCNKRTVKDIISNAAKDAGTYRAYWDGTDSTGLAVQSGTYYAYVYQRDANGNLWSSFKKFTYNVTHKPKITASSTYTKKTNNKYTIKFTISSKDRVTVRIKNANKQVVRSIVYQQEYSAGTRTVTWDGRDDEGRVVNGGTYYVYVYKYLDNNKAYSAYKKFTMVLVQEPQILSGGTFKNTGGQQHKIRFGISTDDAVYVKIKDSRNRVVKDIVSGTDYTDGWHKVYWDGTNNSSENVASGTYKIYVYKRHDGKLYYSTKTLTYEKAF